MEYRLNGGDKTGFNPYIKEGQICFDHRWLLLIGTTLFTLSVIYYTRHMQGGYDVKATLYTGVASGYNLESDKRTDWATVQNSMDNLISIMQAESTLKRV